MKSKYMKMISFALANIIFLTAFVVSAKPVCAAEYGQIVYNFADFSASVYSSSTSASSYSQTSYPLGELPLSTTFESTYSGNQVYSQIRLNGLVSPSAADDLLFEMYYYFPVVTADVKYNLYLLGSNNAQAQITVSGDMVSLISVKGPLASSGYTGEVIKDSSGNAIGIHFVGAFADSSSQITAITISLTKNGLGAGSFTSVYSGSDSLQLVIGSPKARPQYSTTFYFPEPDVWFTYYDSAADRYYLVEIEYWGSSSLVGSLSASGYLTFTSAEPVSSGLLSAYMDGNCYYYDDNGSLISFGLVELYASDSSVTFRLRPAVTDSVFNFNSNSSFVAFNVVLYAEGDYSSIDVSFDSRSYTGLLQDIRIRLRWLLDRLELNTDVSETIYEELVSIKSYVDGIELSLTSIQSAISSVPDAFSDYFNSLENSISSSASALSSKLDAVIAAIEKLGDGITSAPARVTTIVNEVTEKANEISEQLQGAAGVEDGFKSDADIKLDELPEDVTLTPKDPVSGEVVDYHNVTQNTVINVMLELPTVKPMLQVCCMFLVITAVFSGKWWGSRKDG